jgi:S-adenosylmethionine-diacylglycerol 3-amino-3-carboxypropyl transferase
MPQLLETVKSDASRSQWLLAQAVYGHKSSTSLKERLFAFWFQRLVYTQIWEDPVVDMEALQLGSLDHVVTIASGGCNALSYLTAQPGKVTAVDLNHTHVALVKLKKAALQANLTYEQFFEFFGVGRSERNVQIYDSLLKPSLDADARAYWEERVWFKRRIEMFAKGFYRHGLLGQLIGLIHFVARRHGVRLEDLLKQPSRESQIDWFDRNAAKIFDSVWMKKLCSSPMALYNLGIPPSQYAALCDEQPSRMAEVLKARARRLATVTPIGENYFAWQAFGRSYDVTGKSALPPYLMASHFEEMKAQVHRLHVEQNNFRLALEGMQAQSVDAYVLLDAQDWMSREELQSLWHEISRTARPGARVIFRTAGKDSPVEACLNDTLRMFWRRNVSRSETLGQRDRSGIYGAFHLYEYQG